nr:hypothetical protein [Allomuricauda sp.]
MVVRLPRSGDMRSRITFFENTTPVSASGVVKDNTLTQITEVSAKRIDDVPGIDDDGRLLDISMVAYQLRFDATLFQKGGAVVIRDFDGDYDAKGGFQLLGGRKRYMQIKAVKRG